MSHNKNIPINKFPLWKNLLIVLILILALFYALPNIFGKNPALQISEKDGDVTEQTLTTIESALNKQHILYKKAELSDNKSNISVIFADVDEQLKAKKALKQDLGSDFVIAMPYAFKLSCVDAFFRCKPYEPRS